MKNKIGTYDIGAEPCLYIEKLYLDMSALKDVISQISCISDGEVNTENYKNLVDRYLETHAAYNIACREAIRSTGVNSDNFSDWEIEFDTHTIAFYKNNRGDCNCERQRAKAE